MAGIEETGETAWEETAVVEEIIETLEGTGTGTKMVTLTEEIGMVIKDIITGWEEVVMIETKREEREGTTARASASAIFPLVIPPARPRSMGGWRGVGVSLVEVVVGLECLMGVGAVMVGGVGGVGEVEPGAINREDKVS